MPPSDKGIVLGSDSLSCSRRRDKLPLQYTPAPKAQPQPRVTSSEGKTLKEIRQGVRLKRKSTLQIKAYQDGSGPSKRASKLGHKQGCANNNVQVNLDPDGFYKVHIDYAHCTAIAVGSGLNPSDVLRVIEEDNIERETQQTQTDQPMQDPDQNLEDMEMEEFRTRFDPCSEDELSEEE